MKEDNKPQSSCDRCNKLSDKCWWVRDGLICEECKELEMERLRRVIK